MAVEETIARQSYASSSLCYWICLVSILKISLLVRIRVSRVLFFVPTGDFRRLLVTLAIFEFGRTLEILTCSLLIYRSVRKTDIVSS